MITLYIIIAVLIIWNIINQIIINSILKTQNHFANRIQTAFDNLDTLFDRTDKEK